MRRKGRRTACCAQVVLIGIVACACPLSPLLYHSCANARSCRRSRALSTRVATFTTRSLGEGDSLAEEVRDPLLPPALSPCEEVALHTQRPACHSLGHGCVSRFRTAACRTQVRLLQKDIRRALKGAETDAVAAEAGRAKAVLEGHGPGGDLRKLLKQPMPALLRMLLGPKVNVVTLQARLAPFLRAAR
jgi:hypothetical protein